MSHTESYEWSLSIAAHVVRAAPLLAAVPLASGSCLTGILWRPDLVITASSLPTEDAYVIALPSGPTLAARLLLRDTRPGIAALSLIGVAPAASIEPATCSAVGAVCLVLVARHDGTPIGRLVTVRNVLSEGTPAQLRISLDVAPGALTEGAAVFDDNGRLVGMCTGGPDQPPSVIPHAAIADFLASAGTSRAISGRGWVGAELQPVGVTGSLRRIAGQTSGRLVIRLASNGPAAQAGILPGDIILSMDGQCMDGPHSLRSMLGPERVGRKIDVRLARQGTIRTHQLIVAAQPS